MIQFSSINLQNYLKCFILPPIIDKFDKILQLEKREINELVLKLIGNFVVENVSAKKVILESNVFKSISKIVQMKNNDIEISKNIAFIISNILNSQNNDPNFEEEIVRILN